MPSHADTRRTPRLAPLIALLATLVLLAAACGDSLNGTSAAAGTDGVASISDETGGGTNADADEPELEAPEDPEDAFALYSECLADAGIDLGDGIFVAGGAEGSTVEVAPLDSESVEIDPQQSGSVGDFDFEEFEAVTEACDGHLANVDQFFDMSPEQQAAFEDAELEWRKCMEEHGVEVPEFDGQGSGTITVEAGTELEVDPQTGRPSFDDAEFGKFDEAAQECQHHFDAVADEAGG